MPEKSSIHVNTPLTNVAIKHRAGKFIAPDFCPMVMVGKKSDKYFIYDAERDTARVVDDNWNAGSAANLVDYPLSDDSYNCTGHALRHMVTDEERENADAPLQPEVDATEALVNRVMLNQEVGLVSALETGLASYKTTVSTKWNASGDPFGDVETAINSIEDNAGVTPNVMAMDSKTLRILVKHEDILERIVYGGGPSDPAQVTAAHIAALFGLERVLVSSAVKNSAVQGQDASLSRVWGTDVYLGYVSGRPALRQPSLCYNMTWRPFAGSQAGWQVEKFRAAEPSAKSDEIVVSKYYDQKITMASAGYWLDAVWS